MEAAAVQGKNNVNNKCQSKSYTATCKEFIDRKEFLPTGWVDLSFTQPTVKQPAILH